jgi:Zn-dependent protease with chaperone function
MPKPPSSTIRSAAGAGTAPPVTRAAVDPARQREAMLAALNVEVPATPLPPGYGLAMGALVAFLILIPLAYLALLAFLAWLFVWHVYQALASLSAGPYFVFHLPMALLGGLLTLFLIKPVFFRRHADDDAVLTLTREEEPFLFAFVERLCAATGARAPALIEVDCEPNAGARLHRAGVAGAMGKQLVLRVGLPLVAAMPVREFAGVLAHEFGHFNQRSGMTGSYLIRRLVGFFARVVFQRDRLDEKLLRMRRSRLRFARIVFWAAAWLVEAARGVLWLMLIAGELLTCGVLRRMEYDADRVEAHLAGCREFVKTSKLMLFLSIAARRARYDLADAWEQRRLADDLPRLIVAHARQLAESRDDILNILEKQTTRWFDTHPCHNDRVRNVAATGASGLLKCDVSSRHLFGDFDALCKRATVAFYRTVVGKGLEEGKLIPTAELVKQRHGERQSFDALRRFFRNGAAPTRPPLPAREALALADPGRERVLIDEVAKARDEMVELADKAAGAAEQFETSNATLVVSRAKIALTNIFGSRAAEELRGGAKLDIARHDPLRFRSVKDLQPFESAARRRLTAALRLAQTPPWADQIDIDEAIGATPPEPVTEDENAPRPVATLVRICLNLEPHLANVELLREHALNLRIHYSAYDDHNPYPPLVKHILQSGRDVVQILRRMQQDFSAYPYPFAHASKGVSVANAVISVIPDHKDPGQVHAVATSVVDRVYDLLYRALAQLAERVERVERGIGLEPLPDPPKRERKKADDEEDEEVEENRNTRQYWIAYGTRAAGGLAMLMVLVWLSVRPPALPALGWPSGSGGGDSEYRPASFGFRPRHYTNPGPYRPAPTRNDPATPPTYVPGQPDFPQPYRPANPSTPYRPVNPSVPYRPSPTRR